MFIFVFCLGRLKEGYYRVYFLMIFDWFILWKEVAQEHSPEEPRIIFNHSKLELLKVTAYLSKKSINK